MSVSQHTGAFVIRFQTGTDANVEWFEGRVEHVASGQTMHFYSRVALVTFLERMLKEVRGDQSQRRQAPLGSSGPTLELLQREAETES